MINVFISHNYKDKPMARKIATELNRYGIKTWIDESEIKLGDSLIEKIREGLDHMDFLIALISENSVGSEWVKRELDIAMNNEIEGKKIVAIPILVGKCELPGFLKGKLYADMSTRRKYNENILALMKRFDVSVIEDNKNTFTEYELSAVEIIERLEGEQNENEVIEILESFTYADRELFYRDTFIQTVNKLFDEDNISINLLTSLVDVCRFCPQDAIIKLNFTHLLDKENEEVLQSTIRVLENNRSLKIQQRKILKLLKNTTNNDLKRTIWEYFINCNLDTSVAWSLWAYIKENLIDEKNFLMIACLCKLYSKISDDEILQKWYDMWFSSNEETKRILVNYLCRYAFQSDGIFVISPKLRDDMKEALFSSFGESDVDNANLMISLLTGAGNLVEGTYEIWDKLMSLDEYSVQLTLETLRDEYNIAYIFDTKEDVYALKKIIESSNSKIKKVALEVVSEINLKDSLEIVVSEPEFEIQYYFASSLLYTIIKETDVVEYKELYEKTREKCTTSYLTSSDRNLILFGNYTLGEVDVDFLINEIQIGADEHRNRYEIMKKYKLLAEKLQTLLDDDTCNGEQRKKLQLIIKSAESIWHS